MRKIAKDYLPIFISALALVIAIMAWVDQRRVVEIAEEQTRRESALVFKSSVDESSGDLVLSPQNDAHVVTNVFVSYPPEWGVGEEFMQGNFALISKDTVGRYLVPNFVDAHSQSGMKGEISSFEVQLKYYYSFFDNSLFGSSVYRVLYAIEDDGVGGARLDLTGAAFERVGEF